MTNSEYNQSNSQIALKSAEPLFQSILGELKNSVQWGSLTVPERIIVIDRSIREYSQFKAESGKIEEFKANLHKIAEIVSEDENSFLLNIPAEIPFHVVFINSLNVRFEAVRVEILRLSDLSEYKLRKAQFKAREGSVIQIYCEDVSIIKSGGVAFFNVLRACIPQIREVVGEAVVLDLYPSRGLEGFGRTFEALTQWFQFLSEFKNIAILGHLEKSQIAVQLALSLFSGSFNFNQCIGQIHSNHAKTVKAGETNFLNNYSGNYTIEPEALLRAIKDN
jgi:hypothetical protein